jgi:hypothetical protein
MKNGLGLQHFLGHLVYLVYLVCLVYLVGLVCLVYLVYLVGLSGRLGCLVYLLRGWSLGGWGCIRSLGTLRKVSSGLRLPDTKFRAQGNHNRSGFQIPAMLIQDITQKHYSLRTRQVFQTQDTAERQPHLR